MYLAREYRHREVVFKALSQGSKRLSLVSTKMLRREDLDYCFKGMETRFICED